jgi:integrase
VKAVKAWLSAAGITEGSLFRPVAKGGRLSNQRLTDKSVCDLVKAYAGRLGLKATDFGAHSLRAGFLTSAARRGASVFKMRDVSRHKSMDVQPLRMTKAPPALVREVQGCRAGKCR